MPRPFRPVERGRCLAPIRRVLACCLACLTFTASIGAHEVGTTRVVASLEHDDTYSIEVTTDAGALLGRLELARKRPRSAPVSAAEYQQTFDALCDELPRHVSVVFDQRESAPSASCVIDAASSIQADNLNALGVTVVLRGAIPRGAHTFRWRYDLTFASYALTVKAHDAEPDETIWLEGAQARRPVAVARVR